MAKYEVELPIAGHIYFEIEAESKEEAIEKALGMSWNSDNIVEVDSYRSILTGNVCYVSRPKATANIIKEGNHD